MKILLLVFLIAFIVRADVREFQCDAGNTGVSEDSANVNSLSWQRLLPPIVPSSAPVTCGDSVFIPTSDGFYCLNVINGDSLWCQPGSFSGVPAIIGDRVFVIKSESLVCYRLNNGIELWSLGFPATPYTPTVVGDSIFLACDRQVYAVDTAGNSLWVSPQLPRRIVPNSSVCCYDSFVVVTTVRGLTIERPVLVCLISKRTGAILQVLEFGYSIDENSSGSTATIQDGRLNFATFYEPAFPGWIRSMRMSNNQLVWEIRNSAPNYYASACAKNGMVFWPGEGLRAYDTSGAQHWIADVGRISHSSPIISTEGTIWLGNDAGNFYGVNMISGLIEFNFHCGSASLISPATTSSGRVIICDITGNVYRFGYTVAIKEETKNIQSKVKISDGIYDNTGRRVENSISRLPAGIYFKVSKGKIKKIVRI